jgi:spoIIIJ-associated protein
MDPIEAEGDTLEAAIATVLKILGVGRDDAVIDVLVEPRRGVLGIGAKKARVRASLKLSDEDGEERGGRAGARGRNVDSADIAAAEKKGREALAEILRHMGVQARVGAKRGDQPEEIVFEIQGETAGLLTANKGQPLEALHYLLTRMIPETRRGVHFEIDAEGYRDQRRKALEDMALRLGEKAKRQRKAINVDPLGPAERRIVHAALADDPWLTTKSLGTGTYRRMLIVPEGDRKRKEGDKPQTARQEGRERKP